MTVLTEASSAIFTGVVDGVPLNVNFPVQQADELKVRYGALDTLATEGVHYTVALVPPDYLTATVTPMTGFAALSGGVVSVRREVPYLQPTDIPTLSKLASSRLEQIADRTVFLTQQVRDALAYSVRFPTTDAPSTIGLLPLAADRALKYLAFDVAGKPIAVASAASGVPMTAFGQAWVTSVNVLMADVPAFFSTFVGDYPIPALSSSSVGGHPEASGKYGQYNMGIGPGALAAVTNGALNVAIGWHALNLAVHDTTSVAVGVLALSQMNGGDANTAIGYESMFKLTGTSIFNVGVGNSTLEQHTSGSYNVAVGAHAMLAGATGDENTGIGNSALYAVSGGNRNTALGSDAASALVAANDVVALGRRALYALVSGDGNIGIGSFAMQAQTSGTGNTGIGYQILISNVTGADNSALGDHALGLATTSTGSVAIGAYAGYGGAAYAGTGNVLIGKQAGFSVRTGTGSNTFVGSFAGYGATTGAQNTILGGQNSSAGINQITTGSQNISIGYDNALASDTANGQLVVGNFIYGTGLTGTGASISGGKIGFGVKAPATTLEIAGALTLSGAASYLAGTEITAPAAPAADGYRVFAQDNGGGKTQLMVLFNTGAAQQIAIQP